MESWITMRKKWQNRVRVVRKKLKGWNINYESFYRKQKKILETAIDDIDKESEIMLYL